MSCPQTLIPTGPILGCDRLVSRAKVIENQVLAISVISISLDSSDESVGSSTCRIILFGTIPAEIPAETHDPPAPVTSPFLHSSDSFETSRDSAASGSLERPPLHDSYEVTIDRWRSRVAASSSPPSSPTHDFPPAVCQIVLSPSDVPRRPAILVIPGHLASRYPLNHSSSYNFSSDDLSSDYSSGHSFQDSSFLSKDSPFDTPTTISVGPSRKRCRSPAASVPLATTALGALSPVRADLLPPCKRIRGSVDIDVDTVDAETAMALEVGIKIETNVVGVKIGIRIKREDEVKEEAKPGGRGTIEIRVDRVSNIKSAQRGHGRRML
ncbi:hypothetical protein Tco_1528819, partial [Tanacetum coccineum]